MSKPPFRMPQRHDPSAVKLDQWVASGGGEAATPSETAMPRPERPAGKAARLTIDLTPELHARFKAACAIRGTKMIAEVTRFIEEWTQKNG
jgi:hypothetical protein